MTVDFTGLWADGFQIFRNIVPSSVVAEVKKFLEDELDEVAPVFEAMGFRHDSPDAARNIAKILGPTPSSNNPDWQLLSGHFPLKARLSRNLWKVVQSPQLGALVREVLGCSRVFMHMPPMARYVLPGNNCAAVPAHQDIDYNHHLTDFVVVWMPLTPIDGDSGGLAVFEKSQEMHSVADSVSSGGWLREVPTASFKRHFCSPMAPGDCVVFGPKLIHESVPNTSNRIRFSLDMRFFSENERSTRHVLDMQDWSVREPQPHV